jgi:hypothetical protein
VFEVDGLEVEVVDDVVVAIAVRFVDAVVEKRVQVVEAGRRNRLGRGGSGNAVDSDDRGWNHLKIVFVE